MMLVLAVANGPAVAAATCQHKDAQAHAAAVQSADAHVSASAKGEEAATRASKLDRAMGDAAGTLLAGYIVPPEFALPCRALGSATVHATYVKRLGSRSTPPLLEPPLA
jgi:hypothetical protein